MKKFYLFTTVLFFVFYKGNAQDYKYDFNPMTKIARIYTNSEIILEIDVLFDGGFSNEIKFENGYILELENNKWIEKGFYNNDEIIYNKITYPLKTNLIGRVFIKNKSDKKWIKFKTKGNQITLDQSFKQFPKTVQYLVLHNNVRNFCISELKILKSQKSQKHQTEMQD